ncbi:hypothetical protein DDP48_02745 [Helicobacter pylori]|nr:hypothetical protein DDP48_02745 [Helicobacter pylori]
MPVGRVWFSLCAHIVGILQSLSSNAILYHELVAFIPNTKDIWDFCFWWLKLNQKKKSLNF